MEPIVFGDTLHMKSRCEGFREESTVVAVATEEAGLGSMEC